MHIDDVLSGCATNLYALHMLKSKGLNQELINRGFTATILAKLLYSAQFWWGFTNSTDKIRLEAFLRKATKCNFYSGTAKFSELVDKADDRLFKSIINNPHHPISQLLPPSKNEIIHRLRPRPHNYELPFKINSIVEKNFTFRMLYRNSY